MRNAPTRKIDWTFARYLAICAASAFSLAPLLQPKYHDSGEAMAALVTIFTVLAGFMLTVMAIAADGRNLRRKDWRQDTYFLREIRDRLTRYRIMFHLYLVVPALAILTYLGPPWSAAAQSFAEGMVLFFAVFALLWSFRIPGEITSSYVKQLQDAIKDQRHAEHQKILGGSGAGDDPNSSDPSATRG